VHLALGGARADRAPRHEVADVLRRDHVEELAAGGRAELVDAHQEIARDAQSLVDAEAAVQIRIVDQAFPAHGGARLLEVHAHQQLQLPRMAFPLGRQALGISERGRRIMDRAGPDHHQQTVGAAAQDLAHLPARLGDLRLHRAALDREEADQVLRRRQRDDVLDALVVGERGLVGGDGGEVVVQRRAHVFPSQKQKTARLLQRWRFWWDAGCGYPVQSASGRWK